MIYNRDVFKEVLDALEVGVHILDSNGITILYNKACEEIEGILESWIVGKDIKMLVKDGVYSESIALEVIKEGKVVGRTQKVNNRNIFSTGVPIYENGKLVNVIVSVMDVTSYENLKSKFNELKDLNLRMQSELNILNVIKGPDDLIISRSKEINDLKMLCLRVAKVDSTVLILGESGVGKGLFSKYIHDNSNRVDGPFIKIDCSSLSESLIESELFGYADGAFTGARKTGKVGLIQLADRGTLFLDEIGELPLNLQVKLLGVIQEKSFQKVGGTSNIPVDTRIIAATNKDLQKMVEAGQFRSDLYYRLKVVPITIPPLRDRKSDIVPLIDFFLEKLNRYYNYDKTISTGAIKLLYENNWDGNIRELENEIERLVVTSESKVIDKEDLLSGELGKLNSIIVDGSKTFKTNVSNYETILLKEMISKSTSISDLSRITGLEVSTLRKKAKRLGMDLKDAWGNNSPL